MVAFWRRVRARSVRGFGDFTSLFWERAARLASLSGGCALLTGPNPSPTSAKRHAAKPSYPPPQGRSESGNPLLWERILRIKLFANSQLHAEVKDEKGSPDI